MSATDACDFLEACRKKASLLEGDEKMQCMLTRSFNALKSLSGSPVEDLGYLLETMQQERGIARKHDSKLESDPLRGFIYDINEAIEKTIESLIARAQGKMTARPPIKNKNSRKE
ncbi:hypothetical protein PENTCL1PPCAC_25743, partial [Pristionchus entomophagus]